MFENNSDAFNELFVNPEEIALYHSQRFIHNHELSEIKRIMDQNEYYRILVCGTIGSGKTTLLQMLRYSFKDKKPLEFIRAYEFSFNDMMERIHQIEGPKDKPIIIDGLNEMPNPDLLLSMLDGEGFRKIICSARSALRLNYDFTHTVTVNCLSMNRAQEFIRELQLDDRILLDRIQENDAGQDFKELTPLNILLNVLRYIEHDKVQAFYAKNKQFRYTYGEGFDIGPSLLFIPPKLIVPSKEIITNVNIINESLLTRAKEDPKVIFDFSPREFEKFTCEMLEEQGYNVKLTKQTKDGGKDIIVLQNTLLGEFCIYVECKKYAKNRPISVGLVRELYGTVEADKATAGMLITTSYFAKEAIDFTNKIKHRMTLKDYNDLVQELAKIR